MVYSLRRIAEPHVFISESLTIDQRSGPFNYIVVNVLPVCELMSIFSKHFNEFELEPQWIFERAIEKIATNYCGSDVDEYLDCISEQERDECSTLDYISQVAADCIVEQIPIELTDKLRHSLVYGGFKNQRLMLALFTSPEKT